jgi:hypothetical protein
VIAMGGVQNRVRKETGVRPQVGPLAHSVHSGESGFVPPLLAEPQPGGWACASYLEIVEIIFLGKGVTLIKTALE